MTLSSKISAFFGRFKRSNVSPKTRRKDPPPLLKNFPDNSFFAPVLPKPFPKTYCYEMVFTLDDHNKLLHAVVVLGMPWSLDIYNELQKKICFDFGAESMTLLECNPMDSPDQIMPSFGGFLN